MENDLVTYLNAELAERGWSLRELARRAGLSHALISLVLSEQRDATWDFCAKVAGALGEPPAKFFRMAGLQRPINRKEELIEEFLFYWDQLPEPQKRNLMRIAWAMALAREGESVTVDVEASGIPDGSALADS